MSPPSSGGIALITMLNILEGFELAEYGHNSALYLHIITEAMRRAYADRAQFVGDPDFNLPFKATINGQPIWWVDSAAGNTGVREKTDMLLYTRNDLGQQEPFVECGSCHDPHNSSTQVVGQVAFLRVSNAASAVCTACHIK